MATEIRTNRPRPFDEIENAKAREEINKMGLGYMLISGKLEPHY